MGDPEIRRGDGKSATLVQKAISREKKYRKWTEQKRNGWTGEVCWGKAQFASQGTSTERERQTEK